MRSLALIVLSTIVIALSINKSNAEPSDIQRLGSTTLSVKSESDFVHRILLNGTELYVDRENRFVEVVGIYEKDGHIFGLLDEESGGNSCPGLFRIVDITERQLVSKAFGTCALDPKNVHVDAGALFLSLRRADGQGSETFRYTAGRLTSEVHLDVYNPKGPDRAPNNDIAALVSGKSFFDAVEIRAAAIAVTKIMGRSMFTSSRKRIQGGVAGSFESRGDFSVASACVPHNCSVSETAWAFDHEGNAWASWTDNGKTKFFGNPPFSVRSALDPKMR